MLHPTPHGYRLALPRDNGVLLEYDVAAGRESEVMEQVKYDRVFEQIDDAEQAKLLDVLVSLEATHQPSRLSALRSAVRRLTDAVSDWLGGEQECRGR